MLELDPEKVKNSKWVAMLPKSEHPWKLLTYQDKIYAISPGHNPLVLYQDGWKEIQIAPLDFETEAGKLFIDGLNAAMAPSQIIAAKQRPKPWQCLPRPKKKKRR